MKHPPSNYPHSQALRDILMLRDRNVMMLEVKKRKGVRMNVVAKISHQSLFWDCSGCLLPRVIKFT